MEIRQNDEVKIAPFSPFVDHNSLVMIVIVQAERSNLAPYYFSSCCSRTSV
jgi:hypothetical protein